MDKKKGLGRGLEALFAVYDNIDDENITKPKTKIEQSAPAKSDGVNEIDINKITPFEALKILYELKEI